MFFKKSNANILNADHLEDFILRVLEARNAPLLHEVFRQKRADESYLRVDNLMNKANSDALDFLLENRIGINSLYSRGDFYFSPLALAVLRNDTTNAKKIFQSLPILNTSTICECHAGGKYSSTKDFYDFLKWMYRLSEINGAQYDVFEKIYNDELKTSHLQI